METTQVARDSIVGMADLKVSAAPGTLVTTLGSCIGVCLYSSVKKAGGLLHIMLPHAGEAIHKEGYKKAKYADTGIPELLRQLKREFNLSEGDLIAKIFGGAKVLQGTIHNIGADNEEEVRQILKNIGIRIVASKTGGEKGYRIRMSLETGKVACQIFGTEIEEF